MSDDRRPAISEGPITRRRVLQSMGVGGLGALAGCNGSPLGSGPCQDLNLDLSTGTTGYTVADPFGTTDTDWRVVSSPDGTTGQAISIEPVSQWATLSQANWIDPYATGGWPASSDPVGEYVYETDFQIPFGWQEGQCFLYLHNWSADDAATIELEGPNGTALLGQDADYTTLKTGFHQLGSAGQYTLRATVENTQTVTGLLIFASVWCACDASPGRCDLSVAKEFTGDSVTHGGTAEFEVTVCNEGDKRCDGPVFVTDHLPPGTTLASHGGSGWDITQSGGTVNFKHDNPGGVSSGNCLPPLTLTLNVGGPAEVGGSLRNCVTVPQGDEDLPYKRSCVRVPIEPSTDAGSCDLAIAKRHSRELVAPGDTTAFEIEVCNVGDGPCESLVSVVDDLPANLTFVAASGPGWTCTESGGTVTCDHPNGSGLAPGDCLPPLTLEVELGSAEEVGDAVRNCARLVSVDENATNDSDCETVPVDTDPGEPECDLAVTKTHDGETVVEGSSTTFDIEVCNVGTGPCDGLVTVVDDLPTGVTFDAASGSGWSATLSGAGLVCTHANAGGLAPGDCLPTLTLDVTVGPIEKTGDVIRNCARIKGDDVNPANDADCTEVTVEPRRGECDLRVRKGLADDVVYADGTATFEVEVCNDGDGLCNGPVTVVDDLPAGVSFDTATGTGWSVTQSGTSLVCTHPATGGLAPGDCLPGLSIEVSVGSMDETGGRIRNCVRIEGEDANAENDRDCVTVPVEPPRGTCDLAITKTHLGGDVVEAGTETSFEIEVCNVGDGPCNDPVTVVDDLPAGVSFDTATGSGWSASRSGTSLVLTHGNGGGLASGACLPAVTLEVTVGPIEETGDLITNCALIRGEDSDPENDRDCVSVPVSRPASSCDGLEIDKTLSSPFYEGQQGSFVIQVCNNGRSPCNGRITVTDDLPDGLSFASAAESDWNVSVTTAGNRDTVTAIHPNTGGLAPGACLTLTLTVDIPQPYPELLLQNCAQLSVDGGTTVVDEGCVSFRVEEDTSSPVE